MQWLMTCHTEIIQCLDTYHSVVKRKDFSATLKQLTDCLERMYSGSRFHSDGAATANERAPNFVAVLGMTRSSRAADRSLAPSGVDGGHRSAHVGEVLWS